MTKIIRISHFTFHIRLAFFYVLFLLNNPCSLKEIRANRKKCVSLHRRLVRSPVKPRPTE